MSTPITLTGRLGRDPELRFAPSGTAIATMSIVTDKRKQVDGEWKSVDVTWWRVTAFKTLAENTCEKLKKGDPVIISGEIKGREWEDQKTGEKRTVLEVTAWGIGLDLARVKAHAPAPADDPWASNEQTEAPF